MSIPIISDVLDFIKSAVDWTFNVLPRPILFMLFIVMISMIGTFILPFFFNMTGTFCVNDVKVTGSAFNLPKNVATYFTIDTVRNYTKAEAACAPPIVVNDTWYYNYDGGFCTNCTVIENHDSDGFLSDSALHTNIGLCAGDAYRTPDENKTWLQKFQCESKGDKNFYSFACEPPLGYYYDYETNAYVCVDDCIDFTTNQTSLALASLQEAGYFATPPVGDESPPFVGIKCFGNTPKLTFIGIDIFDIRIWALLFLIILLWWAYSSFR